MTKRAAPRALEPVEARMISPDLLQAILAKRCPICLRGPMFDGFMAMRDACSDCGHRFTPEPGFFQGAMFVSYAVGVAELIVGSVIAYVFLSPHTGLALALAAAGVVHLLLVPQLFKYSRVIWAHLFTGSGKTDRQPSPPPRDS